MKGTDVTIKVKSILGTFLLVNATRQPIGVNNMGYECVAAAVTYRTWVGEVSITHYDSRNLGYGLRYGLGTD